MTVPLLVVIPVAQSEIGLASSLLAHLATHGPILFHAVLFVADKGIEASAYTPLLDAAKPIFPAGGSLIHTPLSLTPSYPHAHNLRFETALSHVASRIKAPFLYLSPRCVPTRKGWLLELEAEYGAHAKTKPILGQLLTPESHGTAQPLIASTAIYPPDLPKRVFQNLIGQRSVDFEKSCAELFVSIAHPSKLIWNHPVNGTNALPRPPAVVSVVHTAFAREFAASLRGEVVKQPIPVTQPPETPLVPIAAPTKGRLVKAPVVANPNAAFYHSGDLGDIIYALAAIRLAGGGKLILGPKSLRTPPPANPMRMEQFERLLPLLAVQPYLSRAVFSDRYPGTTTAFDLNRFREQWGDKAIRARTGISTLVRMHCHILGVDEKFHPRDSWLTVPSPIQTGMFVVHRSARYRSSEDAAFPWPMLVKRFKGRLLFVGLPAEHADFQRTFGVKTAFWQCADFLELARVIAGASGFIGNQSFPCALALAAGQRVLQESWPTSPDCVFSRENFLTQPFTEASVAAWESSTRDTMTLITEKDLVKPLTESDVSLKQEISITTAPSPRLVSTTPINGMIELGPQLDASGLGDTLTITPLAERLGKRAIMCLPTGIARFAPLFTGLCPVRITDDAPVFPDPGSTRFIESKLRMFNYECEDGRTPPVVRLSPIEKAQAAKWIKKLKGEKPPIIFHTAVALKWAHMRSRPTEWWSPIRSELEKHFTLIEEYPDAPTPLRKLAARYRAVGRYFGVNTGNWHLAVAGGCRCLVVDADECEGYNPALWRYSMPTCEYVGFDVGNVIAKVPWLLKGA